MESKTLDELINLLPEVIEKELPEDHSLYPGELVNYRLDIEKVNGSWSIGYNFYGWEGLEDRLPHYKIITEEDKNLFEMGLFDLDRCGVCEVDLKVAVIKLLNWLNNDGNW